MIGPSIFPDSNTEGLAGGGLHNVRSHTRMVGPSISPDSQVTPERVVLTYMELSSENINRTTQM